MSEPTPRPWRVNSTGCFIEADGASDSIAAMFTETETKETEFLDNSEANAAHIVYCVNLHDGYVHVCRAAEKTIDNLVATLGASLPLGQAKKLEKLSFKLKVALCGEPSL